MEKGEVGIFPALIEPAKKAAAQLQKGSVVELEAYPGFWVCYAEELPSNAVQIHHFTENGKAYILFEGNHSPPDRS